MNGFGDSNQRDENIKRAALRLARAVKARSLERYWAATDTLEQQFGKTIVVDAQLLLLDPEADHLSPEDNTWLQDEMYQRMTPAMRSEVSKKASDCLTQMLAAEGFVPGSDFSFHPDGGLILSPEANNALFSQIPAKFQPEATKQTGVKTMPVEIEPYVHPLSDTAIVDGKERINLWAFASMVANAATERVEADLTNSTAACLNFGLKAGKTEAEMKSLIRAAKTDAVAIRQLVTVAHEGLEVLARETH